MEKIYIIQKQHNGYTNIHKNAFIYKEDAKRVQSDIVEKISCAYEEMYGMDHTYVQKDIDIAAVTTDLVKDENWIVRIVEVETEMEAL